MARKSTVLGITLILILAAACSGPRSSGKTVPTLVSTPSQTVAQVSTETTPDNAAQTPEPTAEPLVTPAPVTPTPTQAPTPVPTPSPSPTPKPSPTPTPTPKPTPSPTPKPSPTPTETPKPTPTPEPTGGSKRDPLWDSAIKTTDGGTLGVVTSSSLNVRSAPKLGASVVDTLYGKHPVTVYDQVTGDSVGGDSTWYQVGKGQYVTAAYVDPFVAPAPKVSHSGHWVDVNVSAGYLVAYDGKTPVFAAIIITGKEGHETPIGDFKVNRRVADETMDAATVGIPKSSPDYYYLQHVLWTQYFTNQGDALHTNYWSQPWQYGGTGSHGCVNLQEPDAHFLWNFLTIGSPVNVHM